MIQKQGEVEVEGCPGQKEVVEEEEYRRFCCLCRYCRCSVVPERVVVSQRLNSSSFLKTVPFHLHLLLLQEVVVVVECYPDCPVCVTHSPFCLLKQAEEEAEHHLLLLLLRGESLFVWAMWEGEVFHPKKLFLF